MELDRAVQIKGELTVLERRMRPLEWDLSRNQINDFRRSQLVKLRDLRDSLERELKGREDGAEGGVVGDESGTAGDVIVEGGM